MKESDDRQVITYSQPISEHGILVDSLGHGKNYVAQFTTYYRRRETIDTDGWFYIKEDYERLILQSFH